MALVGRERRPPARDGFGVRLASRGLKRVDALLVENIDRLSRRSLIEIPDLLESSDPKKRRDRRGMRHC